MEMNRWTHRTAEELADKQAHSSTDKHWRRWTGSWPTVNNTLLPILWWKVEVCCVRLLDPGRLVLGGVISQLGPLNTQPAERPERREHQRGHTDPHIAHMDADQKSQTRSVCVAVPSVCRLPATSRSQRERSTHDSNWLKHMSWVKREIQTNTVFSNVSVKQNYVVVSQTVLTAFAPIKFIFISNNDRISHKI